MIVTFQLTVQHSTNLAKLQIKHLGAGTQNHQHRSQLAPTASFAHASWATAKVIATSKPVNASQGLHITLVFAKAGRTEAVFQHLFFNFASYRAGQTYLGFSS